MRQSIWDYPGGPNVNGLGSRISVRGGDMVTEAAVGVLCFDYGSQTRECQWPQEVGIIKEMYFPLEPLEEMQLCRYLAFSP